MLLVTGGCTSVILLHYLRTLVHALEHNDLHFLRPLNLVSASMFRSQTFIYFVRLCLINDLLHVSLK